MNGETLVQHHFAPKTDRIVYICSNNNNNKNIQLKAEVHEAVAFQHLK